MHQLEVVSIRLVKDAPLMSEVPINNSVDAVKLLGEYLCELDREVLCVINLNTANVPINCHFVSMGSLQESIAHPREILKSCILSNAAKILLVHNHISGRLLPSIADCQLTDRMLQICDLIGIPLLDHIIVGGSNDFYFSFEEKGMLNFEPNRYKTNYEDISFSKGITKKSKGR